MAHSFRNSVGVPFGTGFAYRFCAAMPWNFCGLRTASLHPIGTASRLPRDIDSSSPSHPDYLITNTTNSTDRLTLNSQSQPINMFRNLLNRLGVTTPAAPTTASPGSHGFRVASEDEDKYLTLEGRKRISKAARLVVAEFAEHPLASHYNQAIEAHLGCFDCIVSDDEAKLDVPENRPCHDGRSKVHKLACGHHVLCDAPQLCGYNCHKANKIIPSLYCLLCFRGEEARDQKQNPTRWHELLLPKYHHPEKELVHWRQFKIVRRPAQPVYLSADDTLVIPSHMTAVMVIAALESIYEGKLKDCISHMRIPQSIVIGFARPLSII
jgi:hypothetical protein